MAEGYIGAANEASDHQILQKVVTYSMKMRTQRMTTPIAGLGRYIEASVVAAIAGERAKLHSEDMEKLVMVAS